MKSYLHRSLFLFIFFFVGFNLYSQNKGSVRGILTDAANGEALPFANVALKGTSIGTVTNEDGEYALLNINPGKYTLIFSYLSYKTKEQEINLSAGDNLKIDGVMQMESILGEEVVVTGMLRGQSAAINQQLKSNTIVNVVSKEKIQELPDQNAAESISRLSGVSIVRDGGEGSKVTLRGMAPRFNSITIDGAKVPSTDDQDRSVDLSMFSTDAIAGIEYYKANLPDMDGDAIGGQINFISRTASPGFHGNARLQTGYNQVGNEYGQYKGSLSLENRFFNDRLGVILGVSTQKANRSSQGYSGDWNDEVTLDDFKVTKLNITDDLEDRKRYNANATIDYKYNDGSILFSTNYGETDRNEMRRRRRYRVSDAYQEYDFRERRSSNSVFSSRLSGKQTFLKIVQFDWAASYSQTRNEKPFISTMRFREIGAFAGNDEASFNDIIQAAKNNLDKTYLKDVNFDNEDVKDDNYSMEGNLKLPFNLNKNLTGYLKTGAKFSGKSRSSDVNRIWTGNFVAKDIIEDGTEDPAWEINALDEGILMSNFLGDYEANSFSRFFDQELYLGPGSGAINGPQISRDKVEAFRVNYADYYIPYPLSNLSDYTAGENLYAAYIMGEFNFYDRITLIGGVRHELTKNNYKSIFGSPRLDEDGNVINQTGLVDTTGNRTYSELLPMVHLKIDLTKWANIRLAVTKSLSRPNFFSLVPWERINEGDNSAERGEPNLKQMTSWNYDAILSLYGKFGLFTFGGFYKSVDNIDYTLTSRIFDPDSPIYGLNLTRPVNAEESSTIKGFRDRFAVKFQVSSLSF